jgi:3-hydroxy-9,10-secoandrosta-1,3,5(10)-triene-9,17-dione monooxygenase reductase component
VPELTDDALTPADERPDSAATPAIDPLAYRRVLGHFPTGVTVVTAHADGGPVGLSIGSFTSVSLDPPLVGFLPARASQSWPLIRSVGRFCVNVLSAGQEELASLFAAPHDDRFGEVRWRPAPFSGAPLLAGVAAWVDCEIEAVVPAGDHDFVLGRVHELGAAEPARPPLIFFQGEYRTTRRP